MRLVPHSPMHQHSATFLQPLGNEIITLFEVLDDILIVHIIDLNHQMLEILDELHIQRCPEHRHHVRDVGCLETLIAT